MPTASVQPELDAEEESVFATAPGSEAEQASTAQLPSAEPQEQPETGQPAGGASARIGVGTRVCRCAGAMLVHAYLDWVGAGGVFATLSGGPARRYDDTGVLTTATLGFALGIESVEGAKHLRRVEAGAAVGLEEIPELPTLRPRLAALADGTDPLGLQRVLAKAMLAADRRAHRSTTSMTTSWPTPGPAGSPTATTPGTIEELTDETTAGPS